MSTAPDTQLDFERSLFERLAELQDHVMLDFQREVSRREGELMARITKLQEELAGYRPSNNMPNVPALAEAVCGCGAGREAVRFESGMEVEATTDKRLAIETGAQQAEVVVPGVESPMMAERSEAVGDRKSATPAISEKSSRDSARKDRRPSVDFVPSKRQNFENPGKYSQRDLLPNGRTVTFVDEANLTPDWYVITPNSRFRVMFELTSVLALGYDAVMTPWIVAWSPQNTSYEAISILTLVFWTIDMLLNFFTGYYAEGEVVLQQKEIAMNYVKTWLFADLMINSVDLVTLVLEVYLNTDSSSHTVTIVRAAPFAMRVMRLLKVSKLLRIVVFFRRLHERAPGPVAGRIAYMGLGAKLVTTVLWLNHVICCMWFFIGQSNISDTGYSWLDMEPRTGHATYRQAPALYQYFTSLHWAITQMTPGSMSVVPQNSLERTFNVCCLLVGLFVGALLVSQLSARMVKMQLENQEQNGRMLALHTYLRENNIGWGLRTRVQHQINERLGMQKRLTVKDVSLLSSLSVSLRRELHFAAFSHHLMANTVFHSWGVHDQKLLEDMCFHAVELLILSKDDEVFSPQTPADKIFLVSRGMLVYRPDEPTTSIIGSGSRLVLEDESDTNLVRPGQWISEVALWLQWTYSGTLTSVTQSELLMVHVPATLELLEKHMKVKALNHYYCEAFYKVVVDGPSESWNDVVVQNEQVLMMLPLEWRLQIMEPLVYSAFQQKNAMVTSWTRSENMEPLLQEIRKGKSIIVLNAGVLERTVPLVVLGIERRHTCDILVQLAKGENGKLVVSPQLPGTKVRQGENPERAMRRLVNNLFPVVSDHLHMRQMVNHNEARDSPTFKIHSKYTIYRFEGTLDWFEKPMGKVVNESEVGVPTPCAMTRQRSASPFRLTYPFGRHRSLPGEGDTILSSLDASESFLMSTGLGELNLYAWLTETDFDNLKLPKGQEVLRSWVSLNEGEFPLLDEQLQEVDMVRASTASSRPVRFLDLEPADCRAGFLSL